MPENQNQQKQPWFSIQANIDEFLDNCRKYHYMAAAARKCGIDPWLPYHVKDPDLKQQMRDACEAGKKEFRSRGNDATRFAVLDTLMEEASKPSDERDHKIFLEYAYLFMKINADADRMALLRGNVPDAPKITFDLGALDKATRDKIRTAAQEAQAQLNNELNDAELYAVI